MTTAIALRLRPDVARVVALHLLKWPRGSSERDEWLAYGQFKAELSAATGWDARPAWHNAGQYAAAVAAYLERVGL